MLGVFYVFSYSSFKRVTYLGNLGSATVVGNFVDTLVEKRVGFVLYRSESLFNSFEGFSRLFYFIFYQYFSIFCGSMEEGEVCFGVWGYKREFR